MATYKFDWVNSGAEIADPEITISADGISIYPTTMEIDVDVLLTSNGTKIGVRLYNVKVENLNYDTDSLGLRVLAKLDEFKV